MRRLAVPLLFVVMVSLATILPPVYASPGDGAKTVLQA
jgi:hypothetical protein